MVARGYKCRAKRRAASMIEVIPGAGYTRTNTVEVVLYSEVYRIFRQLRRVFPGALRGPDGVSRASFSAAFVAPAERSETERVRGITRCIPSEIRLYGIANARKSLLSSSVI